MTALMYLNDGFGGGVTKFTHSSLGVSIVPRRGKLLLFKCFDVDRWVAPPESRHQVMKMAFYTDKMRKHYRLRPRNVHVVQTNKLRQVPPSHCARVRKPRRCR